MRFDNPCQRCGVKANYNKDDPAESNLFYYRAEGSDTYDFNLCTNCARALFQWLHDDLLVGIIDADIKCAMEESKNV